MMLILLMALVLGLFNIIMVNYISNNVVLLLDIALWTSFHCWFNKIEKRIMIKKARDEEKRKKAMPQFPPAQIAQTIKL